MAHITKALPDYLISRATNGLLCPWKTDYLSVIEKGPSSLS